MHLEHDATAVQPDVPSDPAAEQRMANRRAHRGLVLDRLADRVGYRDAAGDPDATATALRERAELIVDAALPPDPVHGRRGSVPLLLRCGRGYRPVLIAHHRITDPGSGAWTATLNNPTSPGTDRARKPRAHPDDQLKLAHASRLLEAAGVATPGPARGGVIGLDADVVVWHELEAGSWSGGHTALGEYDRRFADRLAIAATAERGERQLADPSRIVACRRCPWWARCRDALLERRDVSLVTNGNDADALRAAGVTTVDQLAALEYGTVLDGVGGSLREVIALARAWLADRTVIRKVDRVTAPRADVEVDVDMESFGDAGAYLWGCLLSGAPVGIEPGYHPFCTWEALPSEDEGRSFARFWRWFSEVRERAAARGLTFHAYCYNEQAENRWLLASAERFAHVDGVPARKTVRAFIDSPEWVDLYAYVTSQFLCAQGKGLKVIAPVAGFGWQDPEAGGENSMRWYRQAVGYGGTEPDQSQRKRLLEYNEDDVRATYTLRNWMCGAANQLPHLEGLERPDLDTASAENTAHG